MTAACEGAGLIPIGVDGKSLRGATADTATGCLHLVSAWATARPMTGWVLVEPEGVKDDGLLNEWIQRALQFIGMLPAK